MYSKYPLEVIEKAVEATFLLCEKAKKPLKKPFEKIEDIIYGLDTEKYLHFYPKNLTLKLTSNCNLRCKHCFFYGKPECYCDEKDLQPNVLFNYLKEVVEQVYLMQCTITGGEIFTSPIIKEVIEYLKSKNIALSLITNATLINEDIVNWLSLSLRTGYDHIQISLDGATPEVNDKIRGAGAYEKTIKAIKLLVSKNITVEVGFTVNSQNVFQIPDLYKLCKSLGVSKLNLGRFMLSESSQEYLVPDFQDIFMSLSELSKIYDENGTELEIRCVRIPQFIDYQKGRELADKKLSDIKKNPTYLHCSPHHESFALFPNGDITLCYACDRADCIIGNITQKSFEEIWSQRFNFAIFGERKTEDNACKNCKYLPLCCCGCLYESYKKHGTIDSTAFDCKYFEEMKEI